MADLSQSVSRRRLEEIEPWLVEVARMLTQVVSDANHFGAAEWSGAGVLARVERTANGIRASFWALEVD